MTDTAAPTADEHPPAREADDDRHAKLTELFGEAIMLPPIGRSALLRRVRASPDASLADELASLLAADEQRGLATADLVPTLDERPTQREFAYIKIPGYRVTDILGEGGMGTVYAGEQVDPRRAVAIKILHVRAGSALARFKAEAQIMARLDHPSIARVLEAGDAEGHPFLVMELVAGETLDRYVRTHALPIDRRLALFADLCDAVHHAHVKGVIHRDLKPANVMVKPGDRIVVLDFGVARLADVDPSTDATMPPGASIDRATRAGDLLGTPVYMSPEQALLHPDEVDARSDVYTLGVMFYELISGALPYEVRGLPLPAVTLIVAEDPIVPLAKRDAAFAGDLDAIAHKALEKEPHRRYSSAAALAEDVRRYLARLPVSVRVPSRRERLARFVRRRPLVALAIGGGLVATTGFAMVITLLFVDARSARHVAEDAQARAESRTNALTLRTARAALDDDPTDALAWLKTLSARDVDGATAWGIAHEAIARGVAHDVLHADTDEAHWVEPLPDGDGFVTGSYDGRAQIWEGRPPVPRLLYQTRPGRGRIHVVRPSPDGAAFAIGSDFGELHVVGRDGKLLTEFTGFVGDVQHIAWSPDGAWLACGDDQGNAMMFPHGQLPPVKLASVKQGIGTITFAPGAVIAGSGDGHVFRWTLEAPTRRPAEALVGNHVSEVWGDADHVEAVDSEGTVRAWRYQPGDDGNEPELIIEHTVGTEQRIKHAAFAADGWVVLGGVGGGVSVVTLAGGERTEKLGKHRSQVRSVAISPDGRWIADGGDDGTLAVHDRATGRDLALRGHGGRIRHLAFARGGGELLSSDSDGIVRRWNLAAIPIDVFDAAGGPIVKLAVSPDAKLVATVDDAGDVNAWRVGTGARVHLGNIRGRVRELAVAAGGVVISGTAEGVASFWFTEKDAPEPVSVQLAGSIEGLAVGPDRAAFASSLGPIALYTLRGEARETLAGHPNGTNSLGFDPSGTLLVSGGQDRVIRVWRRAPGGDGFAPDAMLPGMAGDTHFVAFSPDGALLVTAGNDGDVNTWAVRGEVIDPKRTVVAHHVGAISALAVGVRAIASAGRDSEVTWTPRGGAAVTAQLESMALALAVDGHGGVHAVTHTGAVEHWTGAAGEPPVVEVAHGARAGAALGARVAYGIDGAIVVDDPAPPPLAQLPAALAGATDMVRP